MLLRERLFTNKAEGIESRIQKMKTDIGEEFEKNQRKLASFVEILADQIFKISALGNYKGQLPKLIRTLELDKDIFDMFGA